MYLSFLGLRIFDLSADPTNPVLLWDDNLFQGHDATVVDDILYDFHGFDGTFIYDVTNPASPVLLGSITDPAIVYHHSGWTSAEGKFLFITDELGMHPTADFTVWNINNPANPFKVAEWADDNATVHNVFRVGNFLHVAYYTAGYRVFDLSNLPSITLCDEYDTTPVFGENFRGAFGCYPFAPSGNIYVTDADWGLFVFSFDPTPTGIRTDSPIDFALHQSYPNPFNPSTTISYEILNPLHVTLTVYDAAGKVVRRLLDDRQRDGMHSVSWDGRDDRGRPVSSGVYFYRLSAGERSESRRMILLK
jgi:hypothetical protein